MDTAAVEAPGGGPAVAEDSGVPFANLLEVASSRAEKRTAGGSHERMKAWEPEEDLIILQMVSQGLKWGVIAKELPDRTVASVRNRWQRIEKGRKVREEGTEPMKLCLACKKPRRGHICQAKMASSSAAPPAGAGAAASSTELAPHLAPISIETLATTAYIESIAEENSRREQILGRPLAAPSTQAAAMDLVPGGSVQIADVAMMPAPAASTVAAAAAAAAMLPAATPAATTPADTTRPAIQSACSLIATATATAVAPELISEFEASTTPVHEPPVPLPATCPLGLSTRRGHRPPRRAPSWPFASALLPLRTALAPSLLSSQTPPSASVPGERQPSCAHPHEY